MLTVEQMAHGGGALGRLDGRVGLIDYAVPGEEVRAVIRRDKKDFFQGEAIEVLQAAPERVAPPCPYYGPCGGCQWQHIDYAAQLRYKQGIVEEQLRRIGGLPIWRCLPRIAPRRGSIATARRSPWGTRPAFARGIPAGRSRSSGA